LSHEQLNTARLQLLPHRPAWSLALIGSEESFERNSGLRPAGGLRAFLVPEDSSEEDQEGLRNSGEADPWVHGFAAMHSESGLVMGAGDFTGPPDDNGVVEIVYGVVPDFERQGYATEIAAALVAFAMKDPRVHLVRAHTLPEANASTGVLRRCGFVHVGNVVDVEDGPLWRWERPRRAKQTAVLDEGTVGA
jgi:RimJ/RimL family protein N-acetyltransferase